ncbi:MAG TPA: hypothetical protein DC049_06060, partial [Spirochaetia bacterium]|nr:hypothetical protein [Spirochaetia bacterium]
MTPLHTINRNDIVNSLTGMSDQIPTAILIHSSLSSIGFVDGGADTVIDGFLDYLGANGTLIMPTICRRDGEKRFDSWHIKNSPSDVGIITEVFRCRHGVLRSDHATHSVAACGSKAYFFTSGHNTAYGRPGPWGEAAFGHNSPWEKMYLDDIHVFFLGVTLKVNTLGHFAQSLMVKTLLNQ